MSQYASNLSARRHAFTDHAGGTPFFMTSELRGIMEHIDAYLESSPTLMVVTAASGHGKTTFAKALHQTLDTRRHELLMMSLFHGELKPGWLVGRLLRSIRGAVLTESTDLSQLIEQLGPCLDELAEDGRRLTVVIDNAHKISSADALAEIHTLIDLQAAVAPCLNFLLIGAEGLLSQILATPSLRHRLTYQTSLPLLTAEQCASYLLMRLREVDLADDTFTTAAIHEIHRASGGIFSLINIIAESVLTEADIKNIDPVDAMHVRTVCRHMESPSGHATVTEASRSSLREEDESLSQSRDSLPLKQEAPKSASSQRAPVSSRSKKTPSAMQTFSAEAEPKKAPVSRKAMAVETEPAKGSSTAPENPSTNLPVDSSSWEAMPSQALASDEKSAQPNAAKPMAPAKTAAPDKEKKPGKGRSPLSSLFFKR